MARFLRVVEPRSPAAAVVVVLHGGHVRTTRRAGPLALAAVRMYPFAIGLARKGVAVAFVRYGAAGWNDGAREADGRAAIDDVRARWPGVPIVLLGHSMGARVALRVADSSAVVGVVALAPWVPPGEPVSQLEGRHVVIVQGDHDRSTPPTESARYAAEAAPCARTLERLIIHGGEHKLLRHAVRWQRVAQQAVLALAGVTSRTPLSAP